MVKIDKGKAFCGLVETIELIILINKFLTYEIIH